MAQPTLLDVAKSTGSDGLAGLIEEVVPSVPEIGLLPIHPIKGITYRASVRTALPIVGFRSANEGSNPVNSTFEQKDFSCHVLNPVFLCDKAVADSHSEGADAYLAVEALGMTTGAFVTLAKQIYYGNAVGAGGDTKGFPGLVDLYDPARLQIKAGGTTASTGSSVWLLKTGPMGVEMAMGNNSQLTLTDPITQLLKDANNKYYTAYVQELLAWCGLLCANRNAIGRIANLTEDSGKGLTDALLGKMLSKFPVGHKPNVAMLSRRSLEQLRASRTATNATGAEAPTPTTFEGIPLVVTDSISDTETLVA